MSATALEQGQSAGLQGRFELPPDEPDEVYADGHVRVYTGSRTEIDAGNALILVKNRPGSLIEMGAYDSVSVVKQGIEKTLLQITSEKGSIAHDFDGPEGRIGFIFADRPDLVLAQKYYPQLETRGAFMGGEQTDLLLSYLSIAVNNFRPGFEIEASFEENTPDLQ